MLFESLYQSFEDSAAPQAGDEAPARGRVVVTGAVTSLHGADVRLGFDETFVARDFTAAEDALFLFGP